MPINLFMKQIAIFLCLFSWFAYSYGQAKNNTTLNFFSFKYDKHLLKKNKVATITIEMFNQFESDSNKQIYSFDKEGVLKKCIIQDKKGNVLREFYFSTNSHKDLISKIQKDNETYKVDTILYFKNYENNKLIKDSSSELPVSYYYEYNAMGGLTKMVTNLNYGVGYKTKKVILNKFNHSGRISNSKEIVFENENDSVGKIVSDKYFFYSRKGKLEKEVEKFKSTFSLMSNTGTTNYIYDSRGNLIKVINTHGVTYTYTYNKKGLMITIKNGLELKPDALDTKGLKIESIEKFTYTYWK